MRQKKRRHDLGVDEDPENEEDRLPIVSYVMLVIGYCIIGSILFNAWEKGAVWYVIEVKYKIYKFDNLGHLFMAYFFRIAQ